MAESNSRLDGGAMQGSWMTLRFVDSINQQLGGVHQSVVYKSDYQIGTIIFYKDGPQFEQWAAGFSLNEMQQITERMQRGS